MWTLWRRVAVGVFALSLGIGSAAVAQETSGIVSGTVVDEFGGVLPGARVTLVEEETLETREATTDSRGAFRFDGVPPGGYVVRVELAGFRALEWRGNAVRAGARLSFGTLSLTVGSGETYIGSGANVNTGSGQRSVSVATMDIEPIASRPGDLSTPIRLLPGVRYEDHLNDRTPNFAYQIPNIDGERRSWNQITVDGVNANEMSQTNRLGTSTSLAAVAEIAVYSGGYRAELGRTGGVNIRMVSKGGGTRYTVSPYWDERRSDWAAHRADVPREPDSRRRRAGISIGGPLALPGRSSAEEKSLSFFYTLESMKSNQWAPPAYFRMPTEAERRGDFSQTRDASHQLIPIVDPLTGHAFPGNVIPASRIDPSGQALLNRLPLPTSLNRSANFLNWPENRGDRINHVLRLDWKASARDRLFLSLHSWSAIQEGTEIPSAPPKWGLFDGRYDYGNHVVSLGHTRTWGTGVVNGLTFGARRQTEGYGWADDAERLRTDRETIGWRHGQFHPELNPNDLMPIVRFGMGSLGPDFVFGDRLGSGNHDLLLSVRDDLSWSRGTHTWKAGVYAERHHNNETRSGLWMGAYDFGVDRANPLDTGFAYANTLLGTFRRYEEWDGYRSPKNRSWLAEAYLQDTWKAHSRLTLDYGVRLLWYTPLYQADGRTAGFVPDRYDPARAPRLYRPVRVGGATYAEDPATGALAAPAYVGAYVPGSGDPTNGMVLASDRSYPRGFRENQGIHPEPRIGIAYDLFGDRKTALHASAGLFHQARLSGGTQGNLQGPPSITQGVLLSGTAADLLNGPSLAARPSFVRGLERDAQTPSSYKLSIGVQRELAWGTVLDVSYVAALGRHLPVERDINAVPDGARFVDLHPENRDPRFATPVALPSEFLRPYAGWQSIVMSENWGTSSYNALQAHLTRRYMKGLQLSVAYTFSKALGIADEDAGLIEIYRPLKEWHYAPASYNQSHALVSSFVWDLPKLGGSAPMRGLLDGWQISGEHAWVSGDWAPISLSTTDNFDFDGGDNTARPRMIADPMSEPSNNPTGALFNVSAFARPNGRGDFGNAPRNAVQLPAINTVNLSILKTVKVHRRLAAQLRLDVWNALNTKQASDVNRYALFDAAGNQVNAGFGLPSATRRLREAQISARFKFF